MAEYRIGDYTKGLGVTPDFLKFYEREKIIQPVRVDDNNYRYYRFDQSYLILECLKNRNLGFSVKEIKDLFQQSRFEDYLQSVTERSEEMQIELLRQTLQVKATEHLLHKLRLFTTPGEWYVQYIEGGYFLPQAHGDEFISLNDCSSDLATWIDWLPITASYQKILQPPNGSLFPVKNLDYYWGLFAPRSAAQQLGFQHTPGAQEVAAGRYLVYPSKLEHVPGREIEQRMDSYMNELDKILKAQHFCVCGDCYREFLISTNGPQHRIGYYIAYIPVTSC